MDSLLHTGNFLNEKAAMILVLLQKAAMKVGGAEGDGLSESMTLIERAIGIGDEIKTHAP